mgnify:CR=1 FL=1
MNNVSDNEKMYHYMGIEINNYVWNLLEKKDRNKQDDAVW